MNQNYTLTQTIQFLSSGKKKKKKRIEKKENRKKKRIEKYLKNI